MASSNKQIFDQNLFFLGGLITLVLTISAILNLTNSNNLLTLALFLPVPAYFLYLSYIKLKIFLGKAFNIDQVETRFFGRFSIKEFISQSDWDFLVSIILFALAISLILYKISFQILQ